MSASTRLWSQPQLQSQLQPQIKPQPQVRSQEQWQAQAHVQSSPGTRTGAPVTVGSASPHGVMPSARTGLAGQTAQAAHAALDRSQAQALSSAGRAVPVHASLSPALAPASPAARQLVQWVRDARDHRGRPFIVIDKPQARAFAFDAGGFLRASTPVLMGLAWGDLSVPGIGERPLSSIRPEERTTPAGRFDAEIGRNARGEDILWVDYDTAISLHRVRATQPAERRLERLASATPADNRISYGCINVPVAFYERVRQMLRPSQGRAVVYVVPEQLPLTQVFPGLGVRPAGLQARWAAAAPHASHALHATNAPHAAHASQASYASHAAPGTVAAAPLESASQAGQPPAGWTHGASLTSAVHDPLH